MTIKTSIYTSEELLTLKEYIIYHIDISQINNWNLTEVKRYAYKVYQEALVDLHIDNTKMFMILSFISTSITVLTWFIVNAYIA